MMASDCGVLLYYKYIPLTGKQEEIKEFYWRLCSEHQLTGRIRVAADGVNVTVGGSLEGLDAHVRAVRLHAVIRGDDIDFKLQPSDGARNQVVHHEVQFDKLTIKLCEELVTLGPLARSKADPFTHTAVHLSPQEFHQALQQAAAAAPIGAAGCDAAPPTQQQQRQAPQQDGERSSLLQPGALAKGAADAAPVVLLDTRNIYETRIGHFQAGPDVEVLDPATRCFSDFPAWVDAHQEQLYGKTILMYCTGGVRCERASAYLREKGPGFDQVFQLKGGIQRYLEAFPDGGYFMGKNFVYDDRVAVGPSGRPPEETVVGRCQLCACPWDDYGARLRCRHCRLLLLVCDGCLCARRDEVSAGMLCELCLQRQCQPLPRRQHNAPGVPHPPQNNEHSHGGQAQQAQGTAADCAARASGCRPQQRQRQPTPRQQHQQQAPAAQGDSVAHAEAEAASAPRVLRILCLHGFRQTAKQFEGRTYALRKRLQDMAELVFIDAPHTLPHYVKVPAAPAATQAAGDGDDHHQDSSRRDEDGRHDGAEDAAELPGRTPAGGAAAAAGAAQAAARQGSAPLMPARAKRAWLLPAELYRPAPAAGQEVACLIDPRAGGSVAAAAQGEAAGAAGAAARGAAVVAVPEGAPSYVDELQYTRQTEGWAESLAAIRSAVAAQGPFDGVLGFSQGAAIAAALCAMQQADEEALADLDSGAAACAAAASAEACGGGGGSRCSVSSSSHRTGELADPAAAAAGLTGATEGGNDFRFRFAVLASGFASPAAQHRRLMQVAGPVRLPSMHVYGTQPPGEAGGDRQIGPTASRELMDAFSPSAARHALCHDQGHLIPASRSKVAPLRDFLAQFLRAQ